MNAMLAQEWTKTPMVFPVYLQPKLDGIRCLVYQKEGKWVFQSRTGLVFQSFPHLEAALEGLEGVYDGELYNHDLEFHQITSMVRKKNHTDLSQIQYHVYDTIQEGGFEQRWSLLLLKDPLFRVETVKANSVEEIEAYHAACVEKGYEGIMIRTPGGKYKKGRSKDLLKYKHFKTDEFRVVGHAIGKGDIPVFECETQNGSVFSVMMKSTLVAKREMLPRAEDYYGEWLTVKYQELSPAGIPRFPVGIDFRASRDGKTGVSLPAFI